MPRALKEITAHLRACIANGSIKTALIQTEDLAVLCDAADPSGEMPHEVRAALTPIRGRERQSFEYYAAHYLVGSGLTSGDLVGNMCSLAHAMKQEYETGVRHGQAAQEFVEA